MADSATLARIGGILKNTYGPQYVVEQQNKAAVTRKDFSKAPDSARLGGDHYEFPARVRGARAAIQSQASDDALAVSSRQNEQKWQVFDRMYTGTIKMFEKDIQNTEGNDRAFINHLDDEVNNMIEDFLKVQNIDTFMDGSGILSTISAGATSATQTLLVGTGFGAFGSRYIQVNDVIDIYDSTLTTSRSAGAGYTVNSITPSSGGGNATVVLSASSATTTNDVVVRGAGKVNKTYVGLWSATNNDTGTFQGLSRSTFSILKSNVVDAAGNGLQESYLQQVLSGVEINAGTSVPIEEFRTGQAQWDAYVSLGYAQKRFMNDTLDKGFQSVDYNGLPFKKDVDCPPAAIFALTMKLVQNGIIKPLGWMDREGQMLKWSAGFAAYTAVAIETGNFVYPRPNNLGRIQGLAVANFYAK
jgi:hypothetical protein